MEIVLDDYLEEFLEKCCNINYDHNGAFNSELFIIFALHRAFKSSLFIESGLDNGVSTNKLLEITDCDYIGIDVNRNCKASIIQKQNFNFICGDSNILLFEQVNNNMNRNISIFIDGPKSTNAIELKNKLLNNENVMFVALHDTYDGLENEHDNRIFETKNNVEYYEKYYDKLNKIDGVVNIFNLFVNSDKTYASIYPTGPGLSVYSKEKIKFKIN